MPDVQDIRIRTVRRPRLLVNSYGKTWHTWHTGTHHDPGMDLPYGDPKLMWSFNRDGECDEGLRRARDEAMDLDTDAKRGGPAELPAACSSSARR